MIVLTSHVMGNKAWNIAKYKVWIGIRLYRDSLFTRWLSGSSQINNLKLNAPWWRRGIERSSVRSVLKEKKEADDLNQSIRGNRLLTPVYTWDFLCNFRRARACDKNRKSTRKLAAILFDLSPRYRRGFEHIQNFSSVTWRRVLGNISLESQRNRH